jgi:uracil-DNA glycosylase family 4
MDESREVKFLDLVVRVQACRKCPRMNGSARVLGPGCGPLDATAVFVGEAPGRLGADGSHLPFHGDKSGHNFESLIEQVGISRYHVFVTNAVLCNPKDDAGNNATPTTTEIANCAGFLKEQLEVLDPKVVVTLGAVALKSCALVQPHALTLKTGVRTANEWNGRRLIPAYHPGQRAMVHRSFANQLADYQFIAETIRRSGLSKRKVSSGGKVRPGAKVAQVSRRLLEKQPEGLTYFALHKLFFLAEVAHMEATGERLTNAYVVRQKDGPYCVDLHLAKLPLIVPGVVIERAGASIWLRLDGQRSLVDSVPVSTLKTTEKQAIDNTIRRYAAMSDANLKRVSYLASPMRVILRKERDLRINLFNSAVLPAGKE